MQIFKLDGTISNEEAEDEIVVGKGWKEEFGDNKKWNSNEREEKYLGEKGAWLRPGREGRRRGW